MRNIDKLHIVVKYRKHLFDIEELFKNEDADILKLKDKFDIFCDHLYEVESRLTKETAQDFPKHS